ncbi:MAG: S26 family signal peptidase [Acidimicrobiales bacterium]
MQDQRQRRSVRRAHEPDRGHPQHVLGHQGSRYSLVHRELNLARVLRAACELAAWGVGRRRRVRVDGPSMLPTLQCGEFVLVNSARHPAKGDIVVTEHPISGIPIVKRFGDNPGPRDGIWLISDNLDEGTDSRAFGPVPAASIAGVVTLILNRPLGSLASCGAIGLGS